MHWNRMPQETMAVPCLRFSRMDRALNNLLQQNVNFPSAGSWNGTIFKAPSDSNHSLVLFFCGLWSCTFVRHNLHWQDRLEALLCTDSPSCSCHMPPVYVPAAQPAVLDDHSCDLKWAADTNTFKYLFYTFVFQKIISSVQFCPAQPVGACCSKGVVFRTSTASRRYFFK